MYGVLADTLISAETDPAARVIVLRGEGDMFTSGNDVGEFAAIAAGAVQGERHVSRFIRALAQSTRPLVAAVQGRAVGVGTTMLLHCDFVVLRRECAVVDAVRQSRAGAGSGIDAADADAHRLCARL